MSVSNDSDLLLKLLEGLIAIVELDKPEVLSESEDLVGVEFLKDFRVAFLLEGGCKGDNGLLFESVVQDEVVQQRDQHLVVS